MTKKKPRVIKDYDKFTEDQKEQIKLLYPMGFMDSLIIYTDKDGKLVSALPFETDDVFYLVKMTKSEATQIVEDDDDYDDAGFLKENVKDNYDEKYSEFDDIVDVGGDIGVDIGVESDPEMENIEEDSYIDDDSEIDIDDDEDDIDDDDNFDDDFDNIDDFDDEIDEEK